MKIKRRHERYFQNSLLLLKKHHIHEVAEPLRIIHRANQYTYIQSVKKTFIMVTDQHRTKYCQCIISYVNNIPCIAILYISTPKYVPLYSVGLTSRSICLGLHFKFPSLDYKSLRAGSCTHIIMMTATLVLVNWHIIRDKKGPFASHYLKHIVFQYNQFAR